MKLLTPVSLAVERAMHYALQAVLAAATAVAVAIALHPYVVQAVDAFHQVAAVLPH